MSESKPQFVDYCPSIKQTDEKYPGIVKMLKKTGCFEENNRLTICLQENRKNFAKCVEQNKALGICVKNMKAKNE